MKLSLPTSEQVDILFILEGTFPLVHGGVASWVYQLINAFPEHQFGAIFLGSRAQDYKGLQYELPNNLVHLEIHYLFSAEEQPKPRQVACPQAMFPKLEELHLCLRDRQHTDMTSVYQLTQELLSQELGVSFQQFLYSKTSWEFITQMYLKFSHEPSFIDYFWAIRNMHAPLWRLADIAKQAPKTTCIHCASTGYAGMIGSLLKTEQQCPLILTEHAIYTKERRLDLLQSTWIHEELHPVQHSESAVSYLRNLWINFFKTLAHYCYACADPIISLYGDAQKNQITMGAKANKQQVIPNGVNVQRFRSARHERNALKPPVIALIGRVVEIKDIKTFIRAMSLVLEDLPQVEAWIVGSLEQNPDYVEECRDLIQLMQIEKQVKLLGHQKTEEILAQVDLMILSSISEALPLTILESFAAGVPVVSTDVGACSELIYGGSEQDKALGAAGAVVNIANPQELAAAILHLLQNQHHWAKAQTAAITRAEEIYNEELIFSKYRTIYQKAMQSWQA